MRHAVGIFCAVLAIVFAVVAFSDDTVYLGQYRDTLRDERGNIVGNANVYVYATTAKDSLIPLYESLDFTDALSNPFYSSSTGEVLFYAAPGYYTVVYSRAGFTTQQYDDVLVRPAYATGGVHNVLDYGADPRAAGDDINAFRAAILGAKTDSGYVYVPAGTYRLSEPLYLTQFEVGIVGEGRRSILHATHDSACVVMRAPSNGYAYRNSLRDVTLQHGNIDGLSLYDTTYALIGQADTNGVLGGLMPTGLVIKNGYYCYVEGVSIINFLNGVLMEGDEEYKCLGNQISVKESHAYRNFLLRDCTDDTSGGRYWSIISNIISGGIHSPTSSYWGELITMAPHESWRGCRSNVFRDMKYQPITWTTWSVPNNRRGASVYGVDNQLYNVDFTAVDVIDIGYGNSMIFCAGYEPAGIQYASSSGWGFPNHVYAKGGAFHGWGFRQGINAFTRPDSTTLDQGALFYADNKDSMVIWDGTQYNTIQMVPFNQ